MSDLLASLAPRDPIGWIGWGLVGIGLDGIDAHRRELQAGRLFDIFR